MNRWKGREQECGLLCWSCLGSWAGAVLGSELGICWQEQGWLHRSSGAGPFKMRHCPCSAHHLSLLCMMSRLLPCDVMYMACCSLRCSVWQLFVSASQGELGHLLR